MLKRFFAWIGSLMRRRGSGSFFGVSPSVVGISPPPPPPPPSLGALAMSATTFTAGSSSSGTITGATATSVITSSGLPTGLTINGAARTWAWDGTGTASTGSLTLTETLAGYGNSPRANAISYTISAASAIDAPVLSNPTTTGEWDTALPANAFVGDFTHLLIFSDAGLTTQVQHLVKMITPDEMAGGPANWTVLAAPPPRDATTGVITGLAMGVGARWWYEYIQREDGTTSPNSNVVNATIVATVGNLPNLQLFADSSDITTLFKDWAAATPVTADGDNILLIKDKGPLGNDLKVVAGTATYRTSGGISWVDTDTSIRFESNLNIGCATAVMGMRFDSTNAAWVGMLGQKAAQGGSTVGYAFIRESSNNNFYSRDSDASSLADNTHFWRNKVNQDKNFTPNTIEVYSADGTGRAAGAITFGGTQLCLGEVPAFGNPPTKMRFYGLILAGSTDVQILSAADRHTAEDYIALKSGAY